MSLSRESVGSVKVRRSPAAPGASGVQGQLPREPGEPGLGELRTGLWTGGWRAGGELRPQAGGAAHGVAVLSGWK